ncbi:hypothetical protein CH380_04675 [Leptospira adleri]|uniref:Uncharacterized protein n=1 Tax=Leptospira adleri TaxID=2023186 RepID=A0A2M9YS87_9LEPT|nr:hypothetical protein CH380_04675 [Leptospira adleri]PJZ62764.1 hypothetical protein CH376_06350 [Leptospira adleri]
MFSFYKFQIFVFLKNGNHGKNTALQFYLETYLKSVLRRFQRIYGLSEQIKVIFFGCKRVENIS